jgi:hypothetical protein
VSYQHQTKEVKVSLNLFQGFTNEVMPKQVQHDISIRVGQQATSRYSVPNLKIVKNCKNRIRVFPNLVVLNEIG